MSEVGVGVLLSFGGLGLDLLGRFNTGILVTGLGWSASLASVGSGGQSTPFFDSRITAYVGIRDRPRQAEWRSILLGIGFIPDQTLEGTPTVAPAISLRILAQARTAGLGQFFVSFEPYVAAGVGALRIVPVRFSIGGIIGTKARLAGGQEIDPPRW